MSSMVLSGDTSGTVTVTVPAVAGTNTVTIPAATGTVLLSSTVGQCKAWVNFNGTSTTTIRDSFNVSSITKVATGQYRVNFTTSLSNSNYATTVSAANNIGVSAGFSSFDTNDQNTTRTSVIYVAAPATSINYDPVLVNVLVFSS